MFKKIILAFVIIITSSCTHKQQHLVKIEGTKIPVTQEIEGIKAIDSFIQPYKLKVEKEMNKVLTHTPISLDRKDGKLESSLGNLLADLSYQKANPIFNKRTGKNIDFALFNYGGIRAGITKGEVTTENAFKLMPFENTLVVAELSADKIKELVNYLIKAKRAHPLSKHIKLTLTGEDSYELKINGEELDTNKTYYVLTSDYLFNGGDNMTFFSNPINLHKLDYKLRNAIIDYFTEVDTLETGLDERFIKAY